MNHIWSKLWMTSFALVLMLLFASIGFAPDTKAQSACDSTYTVRAGDSLVRIARQCSTTVSALLEVNPSIINRNLIFTGQIIQIPAATEQPSENPENEETSNNVSGEPQVVIIPSSGAAGTEIEVRISNFSPEQEIVLGIGVEGAPQLNMTTETTDEQGRLETSINVPTTAQVGEYWIVTVRDSSPNGVEIESNPFLVGTDEERVSINPTSGPAGTQIQVDAGGFPGNVPVRVGIGLYQAEPTTTISAHTNEHGNVSTSITLPDSAEPGSDWAVVVGTEDWRISEISPLFSVTDEPETGNGEADVDFVLHTVQRGEWLHRIARQYDTIISAILEINPDISNPNQISVGQQIRIPVTDAPQFTSVNIYLIALNDGGQRGSEIGCNDSAVALEVQIEPTIAPLHAALERLLVADGSEHDLSNVFTGSDLVVEDVNIRNGEAIIYLSGQLNIGGVCDHPRIEEQLARTALQFDTVESVSIFVNGESLSDLLDLR